MIDLRSDTVTKPTDAMRAAMAGAEVGDDVYGEDPTVLALEERVAELFGFEAALFTVTGSLANLLAVRALVAVGEEVLCESAAHIARAELGAHGAVTGVTMRTWTNRDGYVDLDALGGPDRPRSRTVLRHDVGDLGREHPQLRRRSSAASGTDCAGCATWPTRRGVAVHVDGARVWNAHIATGTAAAENCGGGRHVGVCLTKGLGAPVGSLMLGSADQVAEARVWRKRLGAAGARPGCSRRLVCARSTTTSTGSPTTMRTPGSSPRRPVSTRRPSTRTSW